MRAIILLITVVLSLGIGLSQEDESNDLSLNTLTSTEVNASNTNTPGTAAADVNSSAAPPVLNHEKKMYVSPENDIFIQKSLPIYLWISTSPDQNAMVQKLNTEDGVTDHFHLDTEGKNTIRSPWMVDPKTGKYVTPKQDVIFDVYSDGISPSTKVEFVDAPRYYIQGKTFFGQGLNITLTASDAVSGVESIYYSTNGSNYQKYESSIKMEKETDNVLRYYSVDKVGNAAKPVKKEFIIDLTAPVTSHTFTGNFTGNILSADAKIVLESSDELSGVKSIKYKIGDGGFITYTGPISLAVLKDGNTDIVYYAEDNVKNKEKEKSAFNKSSAGGAGGTGGAGSGAMGLYIDRTAPEVSMEIVGDHFQGKNHYVSKRSKIRLTANDNKAGVEKITWGINVSSRTNLYAEPFALNDKSGVQYVNYSAMDKVNNYSPRKSEALYLDKTAPVSNVYFIGPKFYNRDTLFISSSTKIKISTVEQESGLQKKVYLIDNGAEQTYSSSFTYEKDGMHSMKYYAIDNVNNTEETKTKEFMVDNVPPKLKITYSVEPIGEKKIKGEQYQVLPSNSKIYLAAIDNASGVQKIFYKINDLPVQEKTIIEYFKQGNYTVNITAVDVLGNEEKQTINISIAKK